MTYNNNYKMCIHYNAQYVTQLTSYIAMHHEEKILDSSVYSLLILALQLYINNSWLKQHSKVYQC